MYRVVFTSRASHNFSRAEIAELCDSAAERNRISEVTGLFLFDGSRFLQALEGSEIKVTAVVQRIARDLRHFNFLVIEAKNVEHREFHDWSMSQPLYGIGDDPDAYVRRIKHDLRDVKDNKLKALFIGFASLARNARFRYE